jgi:hypothetical protein
MPLYEVRVERRSTVYIEVEAKNAEEAAEKYDGGIETSSFIDDESVLDVQDYDDRFDDDELTDDYEIEQEDTDE